MIPGKLLAPRRSKQSGIVQRDDEEFDPEHFLIQGMVLNPTEFFITHKTFSRLSIEAIYLIDEHSEGSMLLRRNKTFGITI